MVQANLNKCVVKHFPLDTENSFVQYTIDMPEADYLRLTGQDEIQQAESIGKNKMLVMALDNSGSMRGAPIEALKVGAQLIGEKYYNSEQRPFDHFYTMVYNNKCTGYKMETLEEYKEFINSI